MIASFAIIKIPPLLLLLRSASARLPRVAPHPAPRLPPPRLPPWVAAILRVIPGRPQHCPAAGSNIGARAAGSLRAQLCPFISDSLQSSPPPAPILLAGRGGWEAMLMRGAGGRGGRLPASPTPAARFSAPCSPASAWGTRWEDLRLGLCRPRSCSGPFASFPSL